MSDFQIGDSVETLDDTIRGRIIAIEGKTLWIETNDGFQMTYEASELVRISGEIAVSNYEVARIKSEKNVMPQKWKSTFIFII